MRLRAEREQVQGDNLPLQLRQFATNEPGGGRAGGKAPGHLQGSRSTAGWRRQWLSCAQALLEIAFQPAVSPQPVGQAFPAAAPSLPQERAEPELATNWTEQEPRPATCY